LRIGWPRWLAAQWGAARKDCAEEQWSESEREQSRARVTEGYSWFERRAVEQRGTGLSPRNTGWAAVVGQGPVVGQPFLLQGVERLGVVARVEAGRGSRNWS